MERCKDCAKGQRRGFPPAGSPEWEVGTIYFWCPIKEHHDCMREACPHFERGRNAMVDRYGEVIG